MAGNFESVDAIGFSYHFRQSLERIHPFQALDRFWLFFVLFNWGFNIAQWKAIQGCSGHQDSGKSIC